METLIKESGIAAINEQAKATLEKNIIELADEANRNLINAAYTESLLPTVEAQIKQYATEIKSRSDRMDEIEAEASKLEGAEAYEKRKALKQLKKEIISFEKGIEKLAERMKSGSEKILSLRYDAQANMHRIAYLKELTPEALVATLTKHIEGLKQVEAPVVEAEEEVTEPEEVAVAGETEEVTEEK